MISRNSKSTSLQSNKSPCVGMPIIACVSADGLYVLSLRLPVVVVLKNFNSISYVALNATGALELSHTQSYGMPQENTLAI